MAPKKGKGKDVVEDSAMLITVKARVENGNSVNAPVRNRMGHLSYVHPKNGLLYIVGGCDVTTLPQAIKTSSVDESFEPMPFVEWWNIEKRTWGVGSEMSRPSSRQSGRRGRSSLPKGVGVREGSADKAKKNSCFTNVSTTASTPGPTSNCPLRLPVGFSWPTLAAAVVQWGPLQQTRSHTVTPSSSPHFVPAYSNDSERVAAAGEATNNSDSNRTATRFTTQVLREHPMVFFIGGWKGGSRVSQTIGIDMDSGAVFNIRPGGGSSSLPPVTCSTGSVLKDNVYVFGGNGSGSFTTSAMRTLNLLSRKWDDSLGKESPASHPQPRSSHVAGCLLDRYIVIHGGRRLKQTRAETPGKGGGKKSDPKAAPSIEKLGLEFCNDVAVYNLEKERWTATSVPVGSHGPAPRYGHAACVISPTELLFHGGIGVNGEVLSDAWILRLHEKNVTSVTISWVKLAIHEVDLVMFPSRCYHSLAVSGKRVFITGGFCHSGKVDVCIMDIDPIDETVPPQIEPRRRTVTPKYSRRSPG